MHEKSMSGVGKGFIILIVFALFSPLLVSASTCPNLYRNISFGSRGQDVVELQTFLIAQGDLAAGNNTGYFGRLTVAAVQKWQARNGLVSSGTAATTGYGAVGPRTRGAIASVCGRGNTSVSFTSDLTSGAAPQLAYFNVSPFDESLNYYIDFGDGTEMKKVTTKNPHAYPLPGTYIAKLKRSLPSHCYPDGSCHADLRFETIGTVTITVTGSSAREFPDIKERINRDGEAYVFVQVSTVGLSSFPINGTDSEKETWKAQVRVRIQNVLNTLSDTDFTFTNQFDITPEFVGRLKISGYEKLRTNSGVTNITLNNRGSY